MSISDIPMSGPPSRRPPEVGTQRRPDGDRPATSIRRTAAASWSSASTLSLRQFNRLPPEAAEELLWCCLPVQRWVAALTAGRPFRRIDDLLEVARDSASPLTPAELEAALASHQPTPVIPATHRGETALEQRVRQQLETGVELYRHRFGRPFLIQPAGRLPAQILVQLWERLAHDVDTEDRLLAQHVRRTALVQLANIISR